MLQRQKKRKSQIIRPFGLELFINILALIIHKIFFNYNLNLLNDFEYNGKKNFVHPPC